MGRERERGREGRREKIGEGRGTNKAEIRPEQQGEKAESCRRIHGKKCA